MMDAENNEFMAPFDLTSFVSNGSGGNGQAQDNQGQNLGHVQARGHGHGQAVDDNQDRQEGMQQRQQGIQHDLFGSAANMKRSAMINASGANAGETSGGSSQQQHMRLPQRLSGQGGLLQGLDDPSNALLSALSSNSAALGQSQLSLETLQAFLNVQAPNSNMLPASFGGVDGQSRSQQQQQQLQLPPLQTSPSLLNSSTAPSTQALLEHQVRLAQLQQLQQLQNQIFQQQMELISGQTGLIGNTSSNSIDPASQSHPQFRDQASFHGLPTPQPSAELRPLENANFVSPISLPNFMGTTQLPPLPQFVQVQQNPIPQGTSSAPAHLVFDNVQPMSPTGDLDFELSSPWLEAYQHQSSADRQNLLQQQQQASGRQAQGSSSALSNKKRGASSSSGDETSSQNHVRKKQQSPVVRPIRSTGAVSASAAKRAGAHRRGAASLTSTPAMPAMSSAKTPASVPPSSAFMIGDAVGDTPSPVDLSMPPPAPPSAGSEPSGQQTDRNAGTGAATVASISPQESQSQPRSGGDSATSTPSLAPVTPASIMNLGRLGTGLSSTLNASSSTSATSPTSTRKSPPKAKANGTPAGPKPIRKAGTSNSTSVQSTSVLKPLLPGGLPASSAVHLAAQSNYSHHLSGTAPSLNISPTTPLPQPTLQVRKSSHKAAEQKRRDSLKTSFDDLRLLLPPIPLPSDENYDGEPPLPGAMPPRGPPRGEASGPNRAVSKLQLLRCGNQYIRVLKGRVTRRDEYIQKLKEEVKRLRDLVNEDVVEGMERLDLDEDVDAEEANTPRLSLSNAIDEVDEEE